MSPVLGKAFSLSFGGVSFALSSPELPLCQDDGEVYAPFRRQEGAADGAVTVGVRPGRIERREEGTPLFETGESYAVYRSGEWERRVVFRERGPAGAPLWEAEIDISRRRMDVLGAEKLIRSEGGRRCLDNPFRYPLDQIALMYFLGGEGVLCHAAGAVRGGGGVLFAGKSGAGKSTVARLLEARAGWSLLSDDRIVVRRLDGRATAFGTPWPGEAGVAVDGSAPLQGIFFLRHGEGTALRELAPGEAAERLMPVVTLPWYDRECLEGPLGFCDHLLREVRAFDFVFAPRSSAVDEVERCLDG